MTIDQRHWHSIPLGWEFIEPEEPDEFNGTPLRSYDDLPTHFDPDAKPGTRHEREDV